MARHNKKTTEQRLEARIASYEQGCKDPLVARGLTKPGSQNRRK